MDTLNRSARYEWIFLAFLIVVFCALGYWGWWKQYYPTKSSLDLLYLTFQLFTLESGSSAEALTINWPLEVARFGAPIIAAYTVIKALSLFFHEFCMTFLLSFRKGHIVICGLGGNGYLYALDFAKTCQVVVIEKDAFEPNLPTIRAAGVYVVVGDATSTHVLELAGVARASRLLAICGDDATNVQIAETCRRMVEGISRSSPLYCHIHIFNASFLDLLDTARFLKRTTNFDPSTFNFYRAAAAELFSTYPLDRKPIGHLDHQFAHLVIIGFGQVGESVTLQAARIGHFANGRKLKVTIIDLAADERISSFNFRYRQFKNICDLEFIKGHYQDVALEVLTKATGQKQALLTVVVCLDTDFHSLECGLHLKNAFSEEDFPIRVWVSQASLLADIKDCEIMVDHRLTMFGAPRSVCTVDRLVNAYTTRMARAMHDRYLKQRREEKGTAEENASDITLRSWEELDDAFRQSCIQQVEHCPVKLRAIGCSWSLPQEASAPGSASLSGDFKFSDEEIEVLARMEHSRWLAERWLAGWQLALNGVKSLEKKTNPNLVPWEELSDNIKEFDRDPVRAIPTWLQVSRNAYDLHFSEPF